MQSVKVKVSAKINKDKLQSIPIGVGPIKPAPTNQTATQETNGNNPYAQTPRHAPKTVQ